MKEWFEANQEIYAEFKSKIHSGDVAACCMYFKSSQIFSPKHMRVT